MLRKSILSALKVSSLTPALHWSRQSAAFSTFSSSIKTDFFLGADQRKRFYFEKDATLSNIESLLKKEDKSLQSIVFKLDDKPIEDKSQQFVDVFLKKNLKVEINRQIIPVHVDLSGPAAYLNDTPYDDNLAKNEVPIFDSLLLTNFAKILKENLERKHPSKQVYDLNEIRDSINETIQNFRNKNDEKLKPVHQTIEELNAERIRDQSAYDSLLLEAQARANRILKYAIAGTILQWILLFYLTYYEVGWDVVEPIAYLIGLAIEGLGIYFYVRYAKSFRQKTVADMIFKKRKASSLSTKSVNPELELNYLEHKINYFTQRALHSKTK